MILRRVVRAAGLRRALSSESGLDRLMRYKPAISHEEDQVGQMDGEAMQEGMPNEAEDLVELGSDPTNPLFKVGKSLLKLGKVHYRHIESLPDWMLVNQQEVCSHRTPAQIRRCLSNWMIQPDRELQQRYRNRRLTWRLNIKEEDMEEQQAKTMTYGPEESVAYSTYFMPSRFQITRRVFRELQQVLPGFQPTRMVDFGCGPGTAACAALSVWNEPDTGPAAKRLNAAAAAQQNKGGVRKYTGIDMSRSMLDAAKVMLAERLPDAVFWDRSGEVVQHATSRGERFDLAVCSFTLTEMTNDPTRRAAVQLMFELLDVGGVLVIIEAGNPFGSHTTRTARQFILDAFGTRLSPSASASASASGRPAKQVGASPTIANTNNTNNTNNYVPPPPVMILPAPTGYAHSDICAAVVAPCTHDSACPLAAGTWCSFSQRVHSAMIRKGFEEKFSYVVIQKGRRHAAMAAAATAAATAAAAKAGSGGGTGAAHHANAGKQRPAQQSATRPMSPPPLTPSPADLRLGEWVSYSPTRQEGHTQSQSGGAVGGGGGAPSPLQILSKAVEQEPHQMPAFLDGLIDKHDIDWETYRYGDS